MDKYGGYLGLLKWSLAQSDGTKPSELKEMSPEKKEFLESAMKEALVTDADKMKGILKCYEESESDNDKRIECIEMLEDYVLSIDNAKDFDTIHGFEPLLNTIKSYILSINSANDSLIELVGSICHFISTISQNDPYIQNCCLKNSMFSTIYALKYDIHPQLQVPVLSAISSIICGNKTGELYFIKNEGLQYLLVPLSSENPKLISKSMLLLSALTMNNNIMNVLNTKPYMDIFLCLLKDFQFNNCYTFLFDIFEKLLKSKSLNKQYQSQLKPLLQTYVNTLEDSDDLKNQGNNIISLIV